MQSPQINKAGTVRINLTIAIGLLEELDAAAQRDFTSRSDIIRSALLWYLRPQGRKRTEANQKIVLETLNRRRFNAHVRKTINQGELERED